MEHLLKLEILVMLDLFRNSLINTLFSISFKKDSSNVFLNYYALETRLIIFFIFSKM